MQLNHLGCEESGAEQGALGGGPLNSQRIGRGDHPVEEGKARPDTPSHCHVSELQQRQQTLIYELFSVPKGAGEDETDCDGDGGESGQQEAPMRNGPGFS